MGADAFTEERTRRWRDWREIAGMNSSKETNAAEGRKKEGAASGMRGRRMRLILTIRSRGGKSSGNNPRRWNVASIC